jgi:hypothetical protein
VFRISKNGQAPIVDVDTVAEIERAIRSNPPRRYHVDELPTTPFPSGHTSRNLDFLIVPGRIRVRYEVAPDGIGAGRLRALPLLVD